MNRNTTLPSARDARGHQPNPTRRPMTPAEHDVFRFLVNYRRANLGFSPSHREIAEGLRRRYRTVAEQLVSLQRKGWTFQRPGVARSIAPLARLEDVVLDENSEGAA